MSEVGGNGPPVPDGAADDGAWQRLDKRHPTRRMRTRAGIWMGGLFVFMASTHVFLRHGSVLEFVVGVVSLSVAWTLSVFGHELGHVVGAHAVGLRPFALVVGGGPNLLLREVRGVAVDLGILPGSGLTLMASSELAPRIKWRLFVAYASGPLISAALLTVGLVAFPEQWRAFHETNEPSLGPATALILVNGFLLFTSAVPLPRSSDAGCPRNDLSQIVMLPWMKPQALESLVKAARGATFYRLFQLRRYQAAFDESRRRLAEDPADWMTRVQLADMLIFSRRYAEAAREYGALLDEPALSAEGVPPLAAAFVANNCAWASYMQDGDEMLEAADSASSKAIALVPKNPYILGTRGAVLVARGEIEKGREFLERARKHHRGALERASNFACLALAAVAEGRTKEALRHFERALRLDPDLELRTRVERALSVPPHASTTAPQRTP